MIGRPRACADRPNIWFQLVQAIRRPDQGADSLARDKTSDAYRDFFGDQCLESQRRRIGGENRSASLTEFLGPQKYTSEVAERTEEPGVATGLAWTSVGGEILFIEGTFMPGAGKLTLTGQLGDVMKESATISVSLIRSRLASSEKGFNFNESDIHIHVPSGATPKDGPSAGITIFSALVSLITGKTVDANVAMTGEVTLSGAVLPVGGIKEKVLAAHRAGIRKVLLPKENVPDLQDVPDDVRTELTFVPVENIEEVLKEAMGISLPPRVPLVTIPGNNFVPVQNL